MGPLLGDLERFTETSEEAMSRFARETRSVARLEGAILAGILLVTLDLRQRYGVNVVSIRSSRDAEYSIVPDPKRRLEQGEELLLVGRLDGLEKLRRELL